MALRCQFPFQGSGSPSSLVLGVHLPAIKSFFCLLSSCGSVPRQEGAASSAAQLCPAASHLQSEQRSQSSALYNSTAKLILRQCNSTEPWGRRSHRQESLLPSASPSPLDQKFLFLTPLRGVTGHLAVSSLLQFSIPPKNRNAQYSSGQPKGAQASPCPAGGGAHKHK